MNLKVIHIIPGSEHSASSMIFTKRQVSALGKMGVENEIFYLRSRMNPITMMKAASDFLRLKRQFRPSIVHAHYGTVTALFAILGLPGRLVISFQGSDLNKTPQDGRLRDITGRLFSNVAAIFASKIICVSAALKSRLWFGKRKAEVIPIGINLEHFKPMDQNEAREKLGWKKEEFIIFFNASNARIKRPDIAQRCVEILNQKSAIPVRLENMDGNADPSSIPLIMNGCDCLLLCSDSEGSPMVVKEAMACNLPVVSSFVGDVAERLKEVQPGDVVQQSPEQLAEAILRLSHSKGQRSNGREILRKQGLSDEATCSKIMDLYNSLIN